MKITRITLFAAILLSLIGSDLRAEYVFLTDGSIIKCAIESETPKGTIIRLPSGKIMTINPKDILRTLYTELYMGKIHIQKVDGGTIDAYMVDEDQQSITFRKDINKPEEFVLKRDEILFTTRKNPVGLEGTAKTDQIILKWKPPYTKVKEYNIYIKSDKDYILAGKSGSPAYIVRGVKSNTTYLVKVTATDLEGVETLPSNEISIKTPNIQPEPPKNVKIERIPGDDKRYTAVITWEAGLSVDGKISGYRIFEKTGSEFKVVGFAPKNEFVLKDVDSGRDYFLVLRTIDVNGWESGNSHIVNTLPLGIDFSVEGSFILPFGKFRDLHKIGYGGIVRSVKPDSPFYNFETGIAFGYWQFTGVGSVKSSYMVPALATVDYRINFGRVTILPRIAAGFSMNTITYKSSYQTKKTSYEPIVMYGVAMNIEITNRLSLFLGGDAGSVIETRNLFPFLVSNTGLAVKF
jgi:hypothetical protein